MTAYFPRQTVAWHLEEPSALRRLTLSLPAMAVIAGLFVRLVRLAIARVSDESWLVVFGGVAFGLVVLLALAAAHLGNYPIRHWFWRAPLFGLVAGLAEALTSAALIALGVERLGSDLAQLSNWPAMAADIVIGSRGLLFLDGRIVMVSAFALLLAGVVQIVRIALLKHENRDHTAVAIHEEHERLEKEQEAAEQAAAERSGNS